MSAILKDEDFVAVEQAAKARTAPAAFNELSAWREQSKWFGEPESYHPKAMNRPPHRRIFATSNHSGSN